MTISNYFVLISLFLSNFRFKKMAQKPSIPKGTRDFSPAEVAKRNYIFSTIKTNFEKFGLSTY